ncbi:hypothetical protein BCR33DRAFT_717680, partial [Rhizoclosmatium globosum]
IKSVPKHNPRALLNAPIINRHALQVDTPLVYSYLTIQIFSNTKSIISLQAVHSSKRHLIRAHTFQRHINPHSESLSHTHLSTGNCIH